MNTMNYLLMFVSLSLVSILSRAFYAKIYKFAKTLPILLLIIISIPPLLLTKGTSSDFIFIFVGLIFGVIGDFLLLKDSAFLVGLVSFLIGHIFYVIAFVSSFPELNILATVTVLVFMSILGFLVLYALQKKNKKKLILPVTLYIIVIGAMVVSAISYDLSLYAKLSLFSVGAILFAFSDATLAINRFVYSSRIAEVIVLISYYAAQYFIWLGGGGG